MWELQAEVKDNEAVLATAIQEVIDLRDSIEIPTIDSVTLDPIPSVAIGSMDQSNRRDEGLGWVPSRERAKRNREVRAHVRAAKIAMAIPEKEKRVGDLREQQEVMTKHLQHAQTALSERKESYAKGDGEHVCAYKQKMVDVGVSKTAYFGHAYIGKYCKFLCTIFVALAITQPILLRWEEERRGVVKLRNRYQRARYKVRREGKVDKSSQEYLQAMADAASAKEAYQSVVRSLQQDVSYQEALVRRQHWVQRFTKWGQVQQLLGGCIDFVIQPDLKRILFIRAASYSGFFAANFPLDKPTPKQYITLTHALSFVNVHNFSGFGDEETMESQHGDWNRRWCQYRHCLDQKKALETCFKSIHLRNNVQMTIGIADRDRDRA